MENGTIYTLPLSDIQYFTASCYYDLAVKSGIFKEKQKIHAELTGNRHGVDDTDHEDFANLYTEAIQNQIVEINEKITAHESEQEKLLLTIPDYFTMMQKHIVDAFASCDYFHFTAKIQKTNIVPSDNFIYCDRLYAGEIKFSHSKNFASDIRQGSIYMIALENPLVKNIALSISHIMSIEGVDDSRYFINDKNLCEELDKAGL
jgi:hypothetical protein